MTKSVKRGVQQATKKALRRVPNLPADEFTRRYDEAMERLDEIWAKPRPYELLDREVHDIGKMLGLKGDDLAVWRRDLGRVHHIVPDAIDKISELPIGKEGGMAILISPKHSDKAEELIDQAVDMARALEKDQKGPLTAAQVNKIVGDMYWKFPDLQKATTIITEGLGEIYEAATK